LGIPLRESRLRRLCSSRVWDCPLNESGKLAGATFEFSEDDAESIAVGELHIAFSYVPLILHRLTFGPLEGGSVDATFEMRIDFEDETGGDESGFLTREAIVCVPLELDTEPALLPTFSLLDGVYRPATKSILFLEVSSVRFADWLEQWLRSHSERGRVRRRHLSGALSDALQHLAPLSAGAIRRRLIVPTRSSWVAYFDNSILGTDPSPLAHFSSELSCRAVRMCCDADATIFELYGAEERRGAVRCTHHLDSPRLRDERWVLDLRHSRTATAVRAA
jgi:hypothetical protein